MKVAPKYRKMVKVKSSVCKGTAKATDFTKAAKAYEAAKVGKEEKAVKKMVAAKKITAAQGRKRVAKVRKEAKSTISKIRRKPCKVKKYLLAKS